MRTPAAYRALLRLLPRRLREKHGREMQAMFEALLAGARARGRAAVIVLWLRAAADVLRVTAREPVRAWRRRSRPGQRPERKPVMLGSDLRYALRALARRKAAAGLVVSLLALGIAANVAVFSLINGLFLRPFPFRAPDRLVYINETAPQWNLDVVGINYPDFHQWRDGARLFEALALYDVTRVNVSDGRGVERLTGLSVTHDFDDVLGIRPVIGRFFTPDEDRPNGPPVVVIGYGLWREQFGGAPDVLGRTLRMNGKPHEIIGVLPREGEFPGEVRFWIPVGGDPAQTYQSYGWLGIGRLQPAVTIADAEADLVRAHATIFDSRDRERIVTPFVRDLRTEFVRDFKTSASAVFVAVVLLLAVACANVASVMLAHAIARRREMGVRLALGATRVRLLRQLLGENLLLAAMGGVAGVAIGQAALRLIVAAIPENIPRWAQFGLDGRVIGFAVLASTAAVFLFGWAPALHAVRGDLRGAINGAAQAPHGSHRGRLTLHALLGAEFALAALLIVFGGLVARAYDRVRQVDPGFRAEGLLAVHLALPEASYGDDAARLAFWDRLLGRLHALPGVTGAGLITCPPLNCHWGVFFEVEGAPPKRPGDPTPIVLQRFASHTYRDAIGMQLVRGRFLEERDGRPGAPPAIVVNQQFVDTLFASDPDPVGRRVRLGDDAPWLTIVGVVKDVKHYGLDQPMRPGVYRPLPANPVSNLAVLLRTGGEPTSLTASLRAAVSELDPELPLYDVRTMEEALRRSLRIRALVAWMLGVFAALGFVLAVSGTYGVTTYLVTQRTREIGIRVALGAGRAAIASAVVKGSLAVAALGVLTGVAASLGLTRLLADLLFGVEPTDLSVLGAAAAVLLGSAALANWRPARRAARVDPVSLLRAD